MPIHRIVGNYAIHKTEKIRAWLAARPRYNIHFTPTSASWLNLVERFFSTLSGKWIKRQARVSVKDLEASIEHYLETHNQNPKPFRWYKKGRGHPCLSRPCGTGTGQVIFSGISETPH